jgi:hypothetical protein
MNTKAGPVVPLMTKEARAIVRVDFVYAHQNPGWHARNSVNPKDCVPEFRAAGGGVSQDELTDLPTAIDCSIVNIESRIAEAQKLIAKLKTARASLSAEAKP